MSFSPAFLDEIRARLPLSEVAGKRLRLTRAGREFKACCPFHNEKSPSFTINDDKQFYHCFGCGAHGDVIGFTMRHDRLSFPEAVESLAAQAGLQVPQNTPQEREQYDREKRLFQLLERATTWFEEQLFAPAGREALTYLQRRGLSEEAIRRFQLGYAPGDSQALIRALTRPRHPRAGGNPASAASAADMSHAAHGHAPRDSRLRGDDNFSVEELISVGLAKKAEDRKEHFSFFRNRVIFPVGDRKGRVVAFGARIMGEGEPKYLNSPDHPLFHKGKLLYGLSRARAALAQNQPLIVAEGYMDVIALVEAGYSGAVAPNGTALTEDQLTTLWKLLPPFDTRDPARDYSPILCFDGDNAGLRAAARAVERAIPLLTPAQTIRIATMPEGQDPDDLIKRSGKSAMQTILDQAKPMVDFIWDMTLANRRLQTPEDRGALIAALKQRVSRIGDENLRKLYQNEIQKRLSAAFNWRPEAAPAPYSGFGEARKGGRRPPQPPMPLLNRKQPRGPHRTRERTLLALMINYPALFADFGEDLAIISFETTEFEALRQRVVTILADDSQEPLDATELYRHLCPQGDSSEKPDSGQASLAEVLSETTYTHAGFARPGRSLEEVRHGWKSIWGGHLLEKLDVDMQTAATRYRQAPSEENLTRLMAIREQKEAMIRESGDPNVFETPFSTSQES